MGKLKIFVVILTFISGLSAVTPNYQKLLYEHDLKSEVSNEYVEIIDKDGEFDQKDGWWGRRGDSKLIIKFGDRLPQVGSVEFTMFGFVPTVHIYDEEHVLCMLTSSWDNPLVLDGDNAWLSIRSGKQYLGQDQSLAFELDAAPAGHATRQQEFTPEDKVWEKGHAYLFRFTFDHNHLTVYIDDEEYARFDFAGQAHRFKYLFLAGDYLHTSIAGIRFSNFKVYTHEPVYETYFVDKTFSSELRGFGPASGGQGVAIADVNDDGLDDMYVSHCFPDSCRRDALYIQQPDSTFMDEAEQRGVSDECCSYGVVFFDADNDGDVDLFNANASEANQLYINNGSGYFSNETSVRGIEPITGDTRGAVAFDANNDGWLDIFAVNNDRTHELYINDGTGYFTLENRGADGETENSNVTTHSVTVADIDNDQDLDIYIAKENAANALYVNDGGVFTQAAAERGVALLGTSTGATFADFDSDGDMDLFVSNRQQSGESLLYVYENDGRGYFTDRTSDYNLPMAGYTTTLMDIDNDGDLDLYRLNSDKPAQLALNDGRGNFINTNFDGSDIVGADARACAPVDFDRDGDLDLLVINSDFEYVYLENQTRNYNNYVKINLVGPQNDAGGVGSKVDVYEQGHIGDANYLISHREVTTAAGYLSHSGLQQHIGLGRRYACDVRVTFSNGVSVDETNVSANQTIELTAPERYNILNYVAGDNQSGTINTLLPQPFQVRLTDQFGASVANERVDFVIVQGDGSFDGSSTVYTNSDGFAAVSYRLGATAGEHRIEARVTGAQHSPVSFTATAQVAALEISKMSGDNQTGTVGQSLPQQLVVQTTYDNGTTAPNIDVTFTVISGGGSVASQPSIVVTSDANGRASVSWMLGTVSGQQVSQASVTGSSVDFNATAVADDATTIVKVSGDGQTLQPGVAFAQPYVAKVSDQYGNPVTGHTVNFRVTAGGGTVNGGSQASLSTDQQGQVSATWTPGPYLGPSNSLQATSALSGQPLNGSPVNWSYAGADISASASTVTASTPVPADGSTTSNIQVVLKDSQNQPVGEGFTVDIHVSGTGNTLNIPNPVTDTNGQVFAQLSSIVAETKTITATVLGLNLELNQQPRVEFQSIDQTPDRMYLISGDAQNAVVNQPVPEPLVVKVLDIAGQPMRNFNVEFVITSGTASFEGQASFTATTDTQGLAHASPTIGTTAGQTIRVEARAENVSNSPIVFSLFTVAGEARKLVLVSGNNQTGRAEQTLPEALAVRVSDVYDNPVAGYPVTFKVNIGECYFDGATTQTVMTDSLGIAQTRVTLGTQQGQSIVEAQTEFSSVTFVLTTSGEKVLPDLARSSLSATSPILADGISQSELYVTLVDQGGAPVPGVHISFMITGNPVALTQPDSITDAQGQLRAFVSATTTGERTVMAFVQPENLMLEQRATIDFIEGQPVMEMISGNALTGTVGQAAPEPLGVKLSSQGFPMSNHSITFRVMSGGGHFGGVTSKTTTTGNDGIAQVEYFLSTVAGENVVVATSPSVPDTSLMFTVTAVPDAATQLSKESGDDQTAPINSHLSEPLQVLVKDAYNNPVPNASVYFEAIDGGVIDSPQPALSDSLGIATCQATTGNREGRFTYKASLESGAMVLFKATAQNTNHPPSIISYLPTESNVTFEYGSRLNFEITQVFDQDNDPVSYLWYLNEKLVGNQNRLILYMSSAFGSQNFVECRVSDGMDTVTVAWTLQLATPVELSSFTAERLERGVQLSWRARVSSKQRYEFYVSRSVSRSGPYARISPNVSGSANDEYRFVDSESLPPGPYFYQVEAVNVAGHSTVYGPVDVEIQAPTTIALHQNYPNPFNPTTTISFELPRSQFVSIVVYNPNGQRVRELAHREMSAGFHTIVWDAKDDHGQKMPSGLYFYQMTSGSVTQTRKLMLLK